MSKFQSCWLTASATYTGAPRHNEFQPLSVGTPGPNQLTESYEEQQMCDETARCQIKERHIHREARSLFCFYFHSFLN